MSRPSIEDDKSLFVEQLQKLGGRAGNKSLVQSLKWELDRYWRTHAILVDEGIIARGKGKGGSVSLVTPETPPAPDIHGQAPTTRLTEEIQTQREQNLYEPAKASLNSGWIKERGFEDAIVEITAMPGRRRTGGTWTRPDLAVLGVRAYPYLPGRHFEIITFEIKKDDSIDVTGVFEALSHLQFASQSYVVFCTGDKDFEKEFHDTERILSLAKLHGVGVIIATDVSNYEVWEEVVEPRRNVPDPEQANLFIGTCFTEDSKARVIKWHK